MKKIFTILFTVLFLHSFAQTNEFWGVTAKGGSSDNGGTIFSTKDDGTNLQTRYSFPINNPGSGPNKIQLAAFNGKLYGTTANGGKFDKGVIFSYDPANNAYTSLFNFEYATGANPNTTLVLVNGKFYGTTRIGGSASLTSLGVIFEFDPITLVYTKNRIYRYKWCCFGKFSYRFYGRSGWKTVWHNYKRRYFWHWRFI